MKHCRNRHALAGEQLLIFVFNSAQAQDVVGTRSRAQKTPLDFSRFNSQMKNYSEIRKPVNNF
jgi:hypothetical protein